MIDLKTQDRIVFELSEKCVYLNEDESKDDEIGFLHTKIESCDEKGLKICDQRLNVKLLNKLGVKSFAEKLMIIEDIYLEDYGQEEIFTDRLRKNLDGYKDGLAIFKEAIQNADDACATEIKICFDRRTIPSDRLLDKNMKGAQGPAILIYSNSIFTEIMLKIAEIMLKIAEKFLRD